ncbi:MAG: histidine kinase [Gammaproteobacteria bacterium]
MSDSNLHTGSFLPDFCSVRTVFVVILLAQLLAIVLSLANPPYSYDNLVDLAMNSLFIQWVALSCTAILCLFRGQFQRYNDHWVATISYGITLTVTFIIAELAWWVLTRDGQYFLSYGHTTFVLRIMGISAIVWALALRYFYVQNQWRVRIESESEARYQALQSRIKPHFLFNCMNTIASLIRRSPAQAEESIEDLADLFRASLQDTQKSTALEDEIDLCKRYLRIEQHRLGDRLKVNWELDAVPLDISLPGLTIQPLLENAIYHGIEPAPQGGRIHIHAINTDKGVIITIINPLQQGSEKRHKHTGNQFAQENVRQRLGSYFRQKDLLQVDEDNQTYTVTITIPHQA